MDTNRKRIGICGVRIFEQNVMPFIEILQKKAEDKGFQIISFVGSTDSQNETDEMVGQYHLVDLIACTDLCALIVLSETIRNDAMIKKLVDLANDKGIPVFSLDRKVEGCYSLIFDNGECFEQIVRHVVEEHGCKYVNMISGDKGHSFSEERIGVYRKVLEENGIPYEEERIGYGNYWERPVIEVMQHFKESELPFPQAIVCANDIMAHAAISELNKYGYEVPEDVIVTGYDGTKNGNIFFPSLTTGAPDYDMTVETMLEIVEKHLEGNAELPYDIKIPVEMKLRQSCGCESKTIPQNDRRISNLLDEIGNGKWHMKSMRLMLGESMDKHRIEAIFPSLQRHMDIYFDFYRYVCIKSELLLSYKTSDSYTEVTNIMDANFGKFNEIGASWNIAQFQSHMDKILEEEKVNTILVHLLSSGKDVYGFALEGYGTLVDWQIKQSDEFAMFVSYILQVVIHNFKMDEMNRDLHEKNKEIEEMSLRDPMTGVYNRRGFFYRLQKITQKQDNIGKYLYLFFVDMDGLKYINDHFGHKEGDFAIDTLAKVLSKMGKKDAICARIGGDEFICAFMEEKEQQFTADLFGKQMEELIKNEKDVVKKEYPISASVGMIVETITADLDPDAMINCADGKMYENKVARKKKRL